MFVVVGLGNPGRTYVGTLHNVGVAVIDELAARSGASFRLSKDHALVAQCSVADQRCQLVFPQTFMNDSGRAVSPIVKKANLSDLHQLIVVHDELDLDPGVVRIKVGGGLAGHNGLKSLAAHLHSQEFIRVRIGVGKPPRGAADGARYVLSRPAPDIKAAVGPAIGVGADAVTAILEQGAPSAMAVFNQRSPRP